MCLKLIILVIYVVINIKIIICTIDYDEVQFLNNEHYKNLKKLYENVLHKEIEDGPLKNEVDKKIDDFHDLINTRYKINSEFDNKNYRSKRELPNILSYDNNDLGKNFQHI